MAPRRRSTAIITAAAITAVAVASTLGTAGSASAFAPDRHFHSIESAGDVAYFSGYTQATGNELFQTDGTLAGTKLVKDLIPGTRGGLDDFVYDPQFTALGSRTIFAANGVSTGLHVWTTDGTAAGTTQLTRAASFPGNYGPEPFDFTRLGDTLYFTANSPTAKYGRVLFQTNGTKSGTKPVAGIVGKKVGTVYAGTYPSDLAVAGSKLYFTVASAETKESRDLWSTDGTTTKRELKASQIPTGTGYLLSLTALGNKIVLETTTRLGKKQQLWLYDGAGVPTAISIPTEIDTPPVAFDGSLFFMTTPSADPALGRITPTGTAVAPEIVSNDYFETEIVRGGKLWVETVQADGAAVKVSTISSGTGPLVLAKHFDSRISDSDNFSTAVFAGGDLYFVLSGVLYKSDGTDAGTVEVKNLGVSGGITHNLNIGAAGDSVGLTFDDKFNRSQLWLSDGTANGTVRSPALAVLVGHTPTIRGHAQSGVTLSALHGDWTPSTTTFAYQWKADGVALSGETDKTLALTDDLVGKRITVTITGTAAGAGSAAFTSKPTIPVVAFGIA